MPLTSSPASPRPALNLLPLYITIFCLLWSFAFVAGKIGVTYCPPLLLLSVRFLLAGGLILGLFAIRRDAWRLSWGDIGKFALLGVVNNALYLGLSYAGLRSVSAGFAGLVISTNPIFTAMLAALLLGEALTWRKIAGLALGIGGVAMIVADRLSAGADSIGGILLTFAALASLVAGTILFKLLAPKGNLWIGNGIQNFSGGLALLPAALAFSNFSDVVPNARLLFAFAYLVLCGSMLAFLIWFHLLNVCGATTASSFHFLMPPLSMLFAWAVLGEHVAAYDLLGIGPVAFGIYLVTRPSFNPARAALSAERAI